jgi:hypothetical protein
LRGVEVGLVVGAGAGDETPGEGVASSPLLGFSRKKATRATPRMAPRMIRARRSRGVIGTADQPPEVGDGAAVGTGVASVGPGTDPGPALASVV